MQKDIEGVQAKDGSGLDQVVMATMEKRDRSKIYLEV